MILNSLIEPSSQTVRSFWQYAKIELNFGGRNSSRQSFERRGVRHCLQCSLVWNFNPRRLFNAQIWYLPRTIHFEYHINRISTFTTLPEKGLPVQRTAPSLNHLNCVAQHNHSRTKWIVLCLKENRQNIQEFWHLDPSHHTKKQCNCRFPGNYFTGVSFH